MEPSEAAYVYVIQIQEEAVLKVQHAITQLIASKDLILIGNEPVAMTLESVFLQLINAHVPVSTHL